LSRQKFCDFKVDPFWDFLFVLLNHNISVVVFYNQEIGAVPDFRGLGVV
jgi:hypothetical protein